MLKNLLFSLGLFVHQPHSEIKEAAEASVMLEALKAASVLGVSKLSDSPESYLLTLEGDVQAVFKPASEEEMTPFFDVAIYEASRFLGFPNISPTVLRSFQIKQVIRVKKDMIEYNLINATGSLQRYFSGEIRCIPSKGLPQWKIFYYLFRYPEMSFDRETIPDSEEMRCLSAASLEKLKSLNIDILKSFNLPRSDEKLNAILERRNVLLQQIP